MARRGVRAGNVLLLAPGFTAAELYQLPVFPTLLHGVEQEAVECGLSLSLASLPRCVPREAAKADTSANLANALYSRRCR